MKRLFALLLVVCMLCSGAFAASYTLSDVSIINSISDMYMKMVGTNRACLDFVYYKLPTGAVLQTMEVREFTALVNTYLECGILASTTSTYSTYAYKASGYSSLDQSTADMVIEVGEISIDALNRTAGEIKQIVATITEDSILTQSEKTEFENAFSKFASVVEAEANAYLDAMG